VEVDMTEQRGSTIEADALAQLDAGDTVAATTTILRGYGPEILGYLIAVLRNEDRAGDAFSIFSENLWNGLGSFKRGSSIRTWAYRIAYNAALRVVRDPQRRRAAPLGTSQVDAIVAEIRTQTALHLRTEKKAAIQALREELTEDEQTLLILRIDRNLDWREVAQILDLEEPALRKRFERVRDKLRTLAVERGLLTE
jgi:RNA polymerase sigma-70 factor (ECF subfamily)